MAELTAASNILGYNFIGVRRPWVDANSGIGGGQNCTSNSESHEGCSTVLKSKGLHNDGWNYTYADGHVKWSRADQTIGKGVNNSGNDASNSPCTNLRPCGAWTQDPND